MKNEIDTRLWREFQFYEVFRTERSRNKLQFPTGANVPFKDLSEDGDMPRITASGVNNGVIGKYRYIGSNPCNYRVYSNFISVSFLGTVFYQKAEASLDMKVHCLQPNNFILDEYTGIFLVSVIKAALRNYLYQDLVYQDQVSSSILPALTLKLPVNSNEELDWTYMRNYIKNIKSNVRNSVHLIRSVDINGLKIDVGGWAKFHLYDDNLFNIEMGTKLDKVKMSQHRPEVNFIGRANKNNGITCRVDQIPNIQPYEAGNLTLSLGGEYLGSCFIQPEPFYTSQNVVVLKPKWKMPFSVKQFIATMIFKESRTYYKAFIDELNRHVKTDFSFYLPVKPDGSPNWQYMEDYMKSIFDETQARLSLLHKL